MITEEKLEANRQNAQKSTGPKTEEGKARSSKNALKHGLTAEHVVLPNEDPEAFNELLDDWLDDAPNADSVERALIERSVRNIWKLRRVGQCEHAVLSKRVRHAILDFDRAEELRVEELGLRLTKDPIARCYGMTSVDPRSLDALDAWFTDDDPAKLTCELRASLQGVDWMLNQWRELDGVLEREGYWHYNDKFRALRLMGRRPQDVLEDLELAMIFVLCNAAHPEHWELDDDIRQACMGLPGKPVYKGRTEYLKTFQYSEKGEPLAELRTLVKEERERLQFYRERLLVPIAANDRAESIDRAMFDDTNTGVLMRRYETACERELHRSIAGLTKLRKELAKGSRVSSGETECGDLTTCNEVEASADGSQVDRTRRRRRPLRNEPTPAPRSSPSNPQTQPVSTPAAPPNDAG